MSEFTDPLSLAAAAEAEKDEEDEDDQQQQEDQELQKNEEEVDDIFDTEGKIEEKGNKEDSDVTKAIENTEKMNIDESVSKTVEDYILSDEQDLFISVEKPEKHISSLETYISYYIVTKTTRSSFDDSEYSVRRRYQDFVWLRGKLEESHPTHLIPPLPAKFIMKGMVDRFNIEFVETRCRALDSFLKRISEHPVISCNEHLKVFLTSEANDFAVHKKSSKPGILSRVGGTVKSAASAGVSLRSKGRDPEFAELSDHVSNFREKMTVIERVAERLAVEEKELVEEYKAFAPTFSQWSSTENQVLAPIMTSFSKCLESCAESAMKNVKDHQLHFIPPIKEYILYSDSIEQVFRRRDAMQMQAEKCQDGLQRKTEEIKSIPMADQSYSISAMMGKKPDDVKQQKEERLHQQVDELTKHYEELSDKLERANGDLRSDIERWKCNKKQDMKQVFIQLADSHIKNHSECLSTWESLVPIMKEAESIDINLDDYSSAASGCSQDEDEELESEDDPSRTSDEKS